MAKVSISVVKGKGSINHNNREFITENVDRDRIKDNIIYKCESLEDAYRHCFNDAIINYNDKQKIASRRIDGVRGYIEKIRTSKNGEKLFYENLIQVGNMYDSGVGTEQGEVCKQILDEYMREFQKRNPNLYVFNAVMHLDEQTPHLHIDYIPVVHGYKNGLQARNSLDKAFREQGVEGKANKYENRTIAWQNREKQHIGLLVKLHGLEVSEDRGLHQKHMTIEQYKVTADRINNEVRKIPDQIDSVPALLQKNNVVVKKSDLIQLERRAKLSIVYENVMKNLLEEALENTAEVKKATYDAEKTIAKLKEIITRLQMENASLKAQIGDLSHI